VRSIKVRATSVVSIAASLVLLANPAYADSIRADEWHLEYVKATEGQQVSKGAGVVIAVVDTGVYPHPDLKRNLLKGQDVLSGGDGIGHVDQNGHGTEMAGLIAGHGRNSTDGVLGIAPAAKILPVKESNADDNGSSTTIGKGIQWAAAHGANVINVSSATGPSFDLRIAVRDAEAADALIVAGSGNRPEMVQFGYPAAIPGVLAVGAIDRSGKHAAISMPGAAVQLCAPGINITSTEPKNKYVTLDGTSSATAIVSGAAALIRAKYPELSAQEVIHRMTSTATDIGPPGRDNQCGYGILNVVKALTADVPPLSGASTTSPTATPPPITDAPTTQPAPSEAVTLPHTKRTTTNVPAVIGGVIGVLLVVGLLSFVAIRRRRSSTAQP
jgi:type VII secretion-associated serine protease mycosin